MLNKILLLIGSLGFLLYGMKLMSSGVQKSAGSQLQKALNFMTGNRFAGLITGLVVTMIIQSSGATTAMVVSFVNAGLLTLTQSVGVIFGANIGTTITAWIVSIFGFNFNISNFALPLFGLGFFMTLAKNDIIKNIGEAVMGFGLLFLGLSGLSDAFSIDASQFGFFAKLKDLELLSIIIGFFIGIVITALMHSSSAFTAIVITMAYNNLISWEVSCAMCLGSNIGSTIDAILASIGTSPDARRSALIHVMFNVVGTALALIFFKPLLNFVIWLTPSNNIAIQISMLHTVFKTLCTICFLPFVNQIVVLSKKIIKSPENKEIPKFYRFEFENSHFVSETPAAKIIRLEKEIANMTDIVTIMFDRLQVGIMRRGETFVNQGMPQLRDEENFCDQMHEQIINYILKCEQLSLPEKQKSGLSDMIQVVDDLEAMSDECFSIGKYLQKSIEKKMKFLQEDMDALIPYFELAREFLQFIHININKHLDEHKLEFARELETEIDAFRKDLKKLARKRLEDGYDVKSELLYLDLVRQIEKIGDHAFSISSVLAKTV